MCACVQNAAVAAASNLRNWLFAVDGSPTMQMLMSPRSLMPSLVILPTPPSICRETIFKNEAQLKLKKWWRSTRTQ